MRKQIGQYDIVLTAIHFVNSLGFHAQSGNGETVDWITQQPGSLQGCKQVRPDLLT
jgi:hypothetical protein